MNVADAITIPVRVSMQVQAPEQDVERDRQHGHRNHLPEEQQEPEHHDGPAAQPRHPVGGVHAQSERAQHRPGRDEQAVEQPVRERVDREDPREVRRHRMRREKRRREVEQAARFERARRHPVHWEARRPRMRAPPHRTGPPAAPCATPALPTPGVRCAAPADSRTGRCRARSRGRSSRAPRRCRIGSRRTRACRSGWRASASPAPDRPRSSPR